MAAKDNIFDFGCTTFKFTHLANTSLVQQSLVSTVGCLQEGRNSDQKTLGHLYVLLGCIPALFVGDLGQKGPCMGTLPTVDLLNHIKKVESVRRKCATFERRFKKKSSSTLLDRLNSNKRFSTGNPVEAGCEIFKQAHWFELTQQQRCRDIDHRGFLNKMNRGEPIDVASVLQIPIFERDNIIETSTLWKDNPWHLAPTIVATNRERHTLNAQRSKVFATIQETVAVRWRAQHNYWEQKPTSASAIDEAMEDDAFFEWFVPGMMGYITDNISKKGKFINGTFVRYHSLCLTEEQELMLQAEMMNACPGDIITLPSPPVSVNVELPLNKLSKTDAKKLVKTWRDFPFPPPRPPPCGPS